MLLLSVIFFFFFFNIFHSRHSWSQTRNSTVPRRRIIGNWIGCTPTIVTWPVESTTNVRSRNARLTTRFVSLRLGDFCFSFPILSHLIWLCFFSPPETETNPKDGKNGPTHSTDVSVFRLTFSPRSVFGLRSNGKQRANVPYTIVLMRNKIFAFH